MLEKVDVRNADIAAADRKLERTKNRLQINNTLLLAIATLAVTWCSYQSNLWNGIQTFKLAESNNYNRYANQMLIDMGQHTDMDVSIILNFANAVFEKNEKKIQYMLKGVRSELRELFSEWMALKPLENPAAPMNPTLMPAYQKILKDRIGQSRSLEAIADKLWKEADYANRNSDKYSLLTVIFSMIMFLGAIGTKITHIRLSFGLILLSGIICIIILAVLFFYMPLATTS